MDMMEGITADKNTPKPLIYNNLKTSKFR